MQYWYFYYWLKEHFHYQCYQLWVADYVGSACHSQFIPPSGIKVQSHMRNIKKSHEQVFPLHAWHVNSKSVTEEKCIIPESLRLHWAHKCLQRLGKCKSVGFNTNKSLIEQDLWKAAAENNQSMQKVTMCNSPDVLEFLFQGLIRAWFWEIDVRKTQRAIYLTTIFQWSLLSDDIKCFFLCFPVMCG